MRFEGRKKTSEGQRKVSSRSSSLSLLIFLLCLSRRREKKERKGSTRRMRSKRAQAVAATTTATTTKKERQKKTKNLKTLPSHLVHRNDVAEAHPQVSAHHLVDADARLVAGVVGRPLAHLVARLHAALVAVAAGTPPLLQRHSLAIGVVQSR